MINIVIAPANTGKANINRNDVAQIESINTLHLSQERLGCRASIMVSRKLMDPNNDETPARCREK